MICTNPECPDVLSGGPAGEYDDHVVVCPRCGARLVAAGGSIPAGTAPSELAEGDVELVEPDRLRPQRRVCRPRFRQCR